MMDKEWLEANNAVKVTSASDTNPNYAALNANGTGPFKITKHEVGVITNFEKMTIGGKPQNTILKLLNSRRFPPMQPESLLCFLVNWTWLIQFLCRIWSELTTMQEHGH